MLRVVLAALLVLVPFGSAHAQPWPMGRFGGVPTISGATCGTGASISGFDSGGTVTLGTGVISACKILFSTTYTPRLRCPGLSVSGLAVAINAIVSTTDLTLTAVLTGGTSVDWFCFTP
jgi:hypothetical protein